jgi:hypothetical protein
MNDKDESEPQAASKLDQCAHSRQVHRKATEDTTNHQDRTLGGMEIHGCLQFLWHVGEQRRSMASVERERSKSSQQLV